MFVQQRGDDAGVADGGDEHERQRHAAEVGQHARRGEHEPAQQPAAPGVRSRRRAPGRATAPMTAVTRRAEAAEVGPPVGAVRDGVDRAGRPGVLERVRVGGAGTPPTASTPIGQQQEHRRRRAKNGSSAAATASRAPPRPAPAGVGPGRRARPVAGSATVLSRDISCVPARRRRPSAPSVCCVLGRELDRARRPAGSAASAALSAVPAFCIAAAGPGGRRP